MQYTVAIDLGSYTLKAIQGKPGKIVEVERTVEVFNPLGLSFANDEVAANKLSQLIQTFFADHSLSTKDVRLALPDALVSTKMISIPPLTDAELASAITWQAEQHIPIPLDDLSLEYQVLYRPERGQKDEQMRVLLIGARKSVIEKHLNVFLQAGIEPTVMETETISLLRALQFTPEDPPTLIVHSGATVTEMAVVQEGELRFSYTVAQAGQLLTRTAEQTVHLDAKQAEEYKRSYGLDPAQLQGKLREVLLPPTQLLISEMQKAMQFALAQDQAKPVKRILLSGGTAQLPGFVQLITEQLGIEVLVASPFATAKGNLPKTNHPVFTVCMGLMMREAS